MNKRNEENLKELVERFFSSEQAEETVEDIRAAERILGEQAAPEPRQELLAQIKSQINARLLSGRRDRFREIARKAVAVAAAVLILVGIGTRLFENGDSSSPGVARALFMPTAIWESDDIAADDLVLAFFTAEIEQIESEVKGLLLGESRNGESDLDEVEMELLEIEGDFWKG